jgi:hypothetical protein
MIQAFVVSWWIGESGPEYIASPSIRAFLDYLAARGHNLDDFRRSFVAHTLPPHRSSGWGKAPLGIEINL